MFSTILLMTFPLVMSFAAANDLFTMRLPNRISLILVATFAVAAFYIQMPLQTVATHVGVGAAVLAVGFALFSFGLLGGGDGKLLAAGALWMGYDQVGMYLAYVTFFGGALSVAILAYRKLVPAMPGVLPEWAEKLHVDGTGIPYGLAIAAGALAIYSQTIWFQALAV